VPILIDGHNLIGRLVVLSLQDPDDEEKLVRLLQSYQSRKRRAITVVFDPGGPSALPKTRHHGKVKVVFAPHGRSADAVIARHVQHSQNPCDWLVVTSDHRLVEAVTRQGARVQSAEDFAAELLAPCGEVSDWKDMPPSSEEVEQWLALFEGQE
jgi:predicted RNA-binding protein with PIN domain